MVSEWEDRERRFCDLGEGKKVEKRWVLSFRFSELGRIVIGFGFQNWGEILVEIFGYE